MIAVTGANGAVGTNLLALIEGRGGSSIALVRSGRAAGQLAERADSTIRIVDYRDPAGVASALDGATSLVHLAGILFESPTSTYQSGNVDSTRSVVDAAQSVGARHIVLVSVLGADSASSNAFLRSKGQAEEIVRDSGINATILRTPILLGPHTAGSATLQSTARSGRAKLLGGGRHILRPLDVEDLARAIVAACDANGDGVAILDLVGPESISYRDLVQRAARVMERPISMSSIPLAVAKLGAGIASRLKGGGFTPDVIDVITASERVDENGDVALGISLTPLAGTLEKLMANEAVSP